MIGVESVTGGESYDSDSSHAIALLDIRRYCAGGIRGAKCSVSKVTGCCSESNLTRCRVPLEPSDRFLLYTDGVTEADNAAGEAIGN